MQTFQAWVSANPVPLGIAVFLATLVILVMILSIAMRRAAQSLRPIVFFVGFVAIVGGPQAIFHLANLKNPSEPEPSKQPPVAPAAELGAFTVVGERFAAPKSLFGDDVDETLIQPAKQIFPEFLSGADHAEMAYFVTNETVLAALFPDDASAHAALQGYLRYMRIATTRGDAATGMVAVRPMANDTAYLVTAGRALMVWTGATEDVVNARRVKLASALGAPPAALPLEIATTPIGNVPFGDLRIALAFLALNVLAAVLWFFKGGTWVAAYAPAPGTSPAALPVLKERLLSVNKTDTPVSATATRQGNVIEITWRYADARWLDFKGAHGMRKVHRLSLRLDASRHAVSVLEYWSEVDADAGVDGGQIRWHAARGIQFFKIDYQSIFGLVVDADGKLAPTLSYAYTFNLQELKGPFIQAVTAAGWTWKPVFFHAPAALRWLTE